LPRVDLPLHLLAPRREAVDPGSDGELPEPAGVEVDVTDPPVVAGVVHECLPPAPLALRPRPHRRPEDLVPVPEDRRRHLQTLALGALDRVPPAVELRLHVLDLDSARRFAGPWQGHASSLSQSTPTPKRR